MTSCQWCSIPTMDSHEGVPRCARCAKTAIDTGAQLGEPLRHVGAAMKRRGLVVKSPVKLVLRPSAQLEQRGLLAGVSPDALGVTRCEGGSDTTIIIAIVSGLPDAIFRAVLVHEYAHAYLGSLRTTATLSPLMEEGFAEALALDYLNVDLKTAESRVHAQGMRNNPDPVYGAGLRKVYPALQRIGAVRLGAAMAAGRLRAVGLA